MVLCSEDGLFYLRSHMLESVGLLEVDLHDQDQRWIGSCRNVERGERRFEENRNKKKPRRA